MPVFVLLELPALSAGEPPYPMVAWHPYGKGKAMFVWLSLNGCAGALDRVRWSRFGTAVR